MKRKIGTSRLIYVSPWLSAAAIGLLSLIIFIFAATNIQSEKQYQTHTLFQKGQALIHFLGAGTRTSRKMGLPTAAHLQNLIEDATTDPGILYIIALDKDGKILAHSDAARTGETMNLDRNSLKALPPLGTWQIVSHNETKAFEVIGPFKPFRRHGRGRFMKNRMRRMMQQDDFALDPQQQLDLTIIVGLDMADLETAARKNQLQIIFMAAALFLVGLGGWISLLTAQGFKVSQETLKRIQAFTGLLISKLPVGIIATDQEGKIKTFNQTAEFLTGKLQTHVVNKKGVDVLPAMLSQFFTEPSLAEGALDREITFQRDEMRFSLHVNSVPIIDDEKTVIGRVLLLHDLTELKNLEKEMQRHEKLVALGKMAAGVAHEVRNPLSSIKGFATLLGSKFQKDTEEKKAADLLINEVKRLNTSITALLDYARPLPVHKRQVDLYELLDNSLKLIESDAQALNITTRLETDPEVSTVSVDPDRINQVLLNLYLNGLQAMGKGGSLTVRIRKGREDETFRIEIDDTGCGIPEDHLAQILTPYFTTKPDGTGLGLAMANKIIDEHGGSITFSSRVNEGTKAIITLPIQ